MSNWLSNLFRPDVDLATRDFNAPEKVFIERTGPYYEYSEDAPGGLNFKIQNLLNGYYGTQNYIELFYSLPEIFAPIHEIAKRVSDANWELRKEWNDEIDWNDADFNRLFSQPNPLHSFKDLIYNAVCYEIITGKQFFAFNKPKALPDEYRSIITWNNLPAHCTHIEMKKNVDPYTATSMNDYVVRYKVPLNDGERYFTPDQILPILHLDLGKTHDDLNCTKSLIGGADKAIRNLIPVYEARGTIYIKRGAMGFFVSRKKDESGMIALTPGEKKQAEDEVNREYGVTGGRRTIGVTQAPIDFVKTSMSIAEMQPFDETLADATAIYSVLRVPKHLIPSKDQSTYANADADMKSFYQDVIQPWGRRYADLFTSYMKLKDFRRYIKTDFSHIAILQEDRKQKSDVDKTYGEVYLQRWQNGACSLNEWIIANEGTKGSGPIYEKKMFELTPDEVESAKAVINLFKRTLDAAPASQVGPDGKPIVPDGNAANNKTNTTDPQTTTP